VVEGIVEQADGQLEDNATALRSLHCTQRAEAARFDQLMSEKNVRVFFTN